MTNQIARLTDIGEHDGVIITASPSRYIDGLPVARIGDVYLCPIHGEQQIIALVPLGIHTDGQDTAHIMALTTCDDIIITGSTSSYQG